MSDSAFLAPLMQWDWRIANIETNSISLWLKTTTLPLRRCTFFLHSVSSSSVVLKVIGFRSRRLSDIWNVDVMVANDWVIICLSSESGVSREMSSVTVHFLFLLRALGTGSFVTFTNCSLAVCVCLCFLFLALSLARSASSLCRSKVDDGLRVSVFFPFFLKRLLMMLSILGFLAAQKNPRMSMCKSLSSAICK